MKIAFYAPLKPVDHPVPSGDRLMARMLVKAFRTAGHEVEIASSLRTYLKEPDATLLAEFVGEAGAEQERITANWSVEGTPDLWFTYHPYYKSPDLIGPDMARRFGIPYATAEASYSFRRNVGIWSHTQQYVIAAVRQAVVNICFTHRDQAGLSGVLPDAPTAMVAPFLDPTDLRLLPPMPQAGRLVTVAMMREGNKIESYEMLAQALDLLRDLPWKLTIVGDGPRREDVARAFAAFAPGRIEMVGLRKPEEIARILSQASVFLWPACREAYGLSFLEAQAAGLPVVAQADGGVREVVENDRTGILTPPGDLDAYATAIRQLLTDEEQRASLARDAAHFALVERSFEAASKQLDAILRDHVIGTQRERAE